VQGVRSSTRGYFTMVLDITIQVDEAVYADEQFQPVLPIAQNDEIEAATSDWSTVAHESEVAAAEAPSRQRINPSNPLAQFLVRCNSVSVLNKLNFKSRRSRPSVHHS
jgi:hypothetical protein